MPIRWSGVKLPSSLAGDTHTNAERDTKMMFGKILYLMFDLHAISMIDTLTEEEQRLFSTLKLVEALDPVLCNYCNYCCRCCFTQPNLSCDTFSKNLDCPNMHFNHEKKNDVGAEKKLEFHTPSKL